MLCIAIGSKFNRRVVSSLKMLQSDHVLTDYCINNKRVCRSVCAFNSNHQL